MLSYLVCSLNVSLPCLFAICFLTVFFISLLKRRIVLTFRGIAQVSLYTTPGSRFTIVLISKNYLNFKVENFFIEKNIFKLLYSESQFCAILLRVFMEF